MHSVIIDEIEKKQMKKTPVTFTNVGDKVCVHKVIVEGKKKRIQKFEGLVVKKQGKFIRESVTVRRIIGGVGVEKSFLIHSPLVPEIVIIKRGKVRRAKLNYLRDRVGAKATRVKSRD
jgi:large subunit ribosomal protein L19